MMILIVLSIVLIPVIINFISYYPICPDKDIVAGDESDWVEFFGSYASALISAFITLFVLYREIRQNALNLMIQKQSSDIEMLERELDENLKSFDFVYLGSDISMIDVGILPRISDYLVLKYNDKHQKASQRYNSWRLMHDSESTEYDKAYEDCLKQYMNDINELTTLVIEITKTKVDINDWMYRCCTFNQKMKDHKEKYFQNLADASISLIKSKVDKLDKMRNQKSKLFPKLDVE